MSNVLITDCLSNIKNMPDEPRVIVIYSDWFANQHLHESYIHAARKFAEQKRGTIVMGVYGSFHDSFKSWFNVLFFEGRLKLKNRINGHVRSEHEKLKYTGSK